MPIYEYHCEPCDHTFETLVRSSGDAAHCPRCGSIEVAKQFSVPAAAQTHSGGSGLPVCGNPEVGRAMGCGGGGGGCGGGMCGMG